jgi:hypothetical protein
MPEFSVGGFLTPFDEDRGIYSFDCCYFNASSATFFSSTEVLAA